jgi:hypothetical protein
VIGCSVRAIVARKNPKMADFFDRPASPAKSPTLEPQLLKRAEDRIGSSSSGGR